MHTPRLNRRKVLQQLPETYLITASLVSWRDDLRINVMLAISAAHKCHTHVVTFQLLDLITRD